MTEPQGIFNRVFDGSTNTIGLQRVNAAASAWTAPSDKSLDAILADVFDETTNTIRIVEV